MFTRVLRHEWTVLARDGSLWAVAVVFALAIGYGTFTGVRWTTFTARAIDEARQEERARFAEQQALVDRLMAGTLKVSGFADPRNPQTAGSRVGARYAILPPSPLAALAVGQSDLLPSYFKVTTDARETVTGATEIENPQRLLTGRFDLAFVIVYLYPLLILALTYNLLSSEQEQGTLAMTLAQPVSLPALALAKVALRAVLLIVAVGGLAGAAMALAGVPLGLAGVLPRAVLWLGAVMAYGMVWFALALLVAGLGRPSSTNAMVLAATWLAFVVVVPSLLNMLATTLYPVPSRVQMIQAVREASDEANEQGSTLLARYYEDHPELAAVGAEQAMNDFNAIRVAVNADVEARVRPVMARFEVQLANQRTMVERLRILSPAILMQEALSDLSGTGVARHQRFLAQVTAFHERWRSHFVPLIFQKQQVRQYADLPVFTFDDESLAEVSGRVGTSVALMLLLALPFGAGAWWRLRRFPVV